MEVEKIYGNTMVELEHRIHEFLDNPKVLYRDIKYSKDEDGGYFAKLLYEYYLGE